MLVQLLPFVPAMVHVEPLLGVTVQLETLETFQNTFALSPLRTMSGVTRRWPLIGLVGLPGLNIGGGGEAQLPLAH